MATTNNRIKRPRAFVINGVDAGGGMQARISAGYDQTLRTGPDGLQIPLRDRQVEYVRGSVTTQDWVHVVALLTGTLGTLVFHERNSGVAVETGYTKHTISKPVVHRVVLTIASGQGAAYALLTYEFECKAADETEGFDDMWVPLAGQAAPNYVAAARGAQRIISVTHGGASINHATRLDLTLAMLLDRACNDGDVGYTCVDADLDGITCVGNLGFEDAVVTEGTFPAHTLLGADKGDLVVTVAQGQGAANKAITIANVEFDSAGEDANAVAGFSGFSAEFEVANDSGTPLTLADANPIIAIA